jgi:hypothetical protein
MYNDELIEVESLFVRVYVIPSQNDGSIVY